MSHGLDLIRRQCSRPADAVRWACILEATAPKVGNVFPGRNFDDLNYVDFVTAAEIAASAFDPQPASYSHGVLNASKQIAERIHTNVNLGILLLLGPIVQSDSSKDLQPHGLVEWRTDVAKVLRATTVDDASRLYAAINLASPGGMGETDEMDLAGRPPVDFISAMRSAKSRDRIARNYADGFCDLFESVVPVLADCIAHQRDLLAGIATAHLQLLATEPDTLIARKFGLDVARDIQKMATIDPDDWVKREALDRYLRTPIRDLAGSISRLNPGTTADLIAAGMYVLLRRVPGSSITN